jgi:hypothetical protein
MIMTRKHFLRLALLGGASLAAACGGSADGPAAMQGPSGDCAANGSGATIGGNHGHVLVVSKADIVAGAQKTYDIRGTADHTHQVTLTAADMASLQQNIGAHEASTVTLSHSHSIAVSCA